MKGYTLESLAGVAITFVIAAVVISVGANIQGDVREQICEDNASNSWGSYVGTQWFGAAATYTSDTGYSGCCDVINATNTTVCDTWYYSGAINTTISGSEGLETMGEWLPTIAIVIMAAVVIGILLTSFRFGKAGA